MMLDTYAFWIVAALIVIPAIFIFIEKKLIHAVIALSIAFAGSALLFFLIGQTLIGLLQLIVFVGGFSTYLIVAVATEERTAKLISFNRLAVLALLLFIGIGSMLIEYMPSSSLNLSTSFLGEASLAFQASYGIFYAMLLLLFSASIGGALIIRKFAKLVV